MCAIVGALIHGVTTFEQRARVNAILRHIWHASEERGRDGAGWAMKNFNEHEMLVRGQGVVTPPYAKHFASIGTMVGNRRAEPTTEYVKDKSPADQQPYMAGSWTIVHNGTIANDKELRTGAVPTTIDSAAIAERLEYNSLREESNWDSFMRTVKQLKGSFAILAYNRDEPGALYVAANYRPVWYAVNELGTFFASSRDYFPDNMVPQMIHPYSVARFGNEGITARETLYTEVENARAVVVCSGGLDSVVAAAFAKSCGYQIELLHFLYGSRAEGPEVIAVKEVAAFFGCKVTLFPLNVYSKGDSPLLDADAAVAGGEAGAEFAHEWVPARNLLLLSVATAFAEARGIETIVLGNNLEEAGAYPDNEPEFIAKFNDMLPFAVADGKRMKVIMPVGNMMKHEIVKTGLALDAPLHLTWSCYRAGKLHCGKCGPCFMRRKAFEINNAKEVIEYAVPVN